MGAQVISSKVSGRSLQPDDADVRRGGKQHGIAEKAFRDFGRVLMMRIAYMYDYSVLLDIFNIAS